MYSSAAKSCAYVAEATLWSPLCTALNVCMRVCVCKGGQEQGRGGTGGRGRRQFLRGFGDSRGWRGEFGGGEDREQQQQRS